MTRLEQLALAAVVLCFASTFGCSRPDTPQAEPPAPGAAPAAEPPQQPEAPAAAPPAATPHEPSAKPEPATPGEPEPSQREPSREAQPGSAAATPCGEKGQPACPLQGWMERHLESAADDGDLPELARGLARVPRFVPDPSWNTGPDGWSAIAEAGADAAKRGDADATKQACKTCHKTWRRKYKDEFRLRAVAD